MILVLERGHSDNIFRAFLPINTKGLSQILGNIPIFGRDLLQGLQPNWVLGSSSEAVYLLAMQRIIDFANASTLLCTPTRCKRLNRYATSIFAKNLTTTDASLLSTLHHAVKDLSYRLEFLLPSMLKQATYRIY